MPRRRIPTAQGLDALRNSDSSPEYLAQAVRYTLGLLEEIAPGKSVEVRVPPYGAVQCIEGARHTRGTPPAVIETDPSTWIALMKGTQQWDEASDSSAVSASGMRTDFAPVIDQLRARIAQENDS